MKYLQDYMEEKQTEVFNKYGVFFAFSKTQFNEGRNKIIAAGILQDGEKITDCGAGMLAPSKNVDEIMTQLNTIYTDSINQDIEENGISNIIQRELDNHEYVITGDITDTVEKLEDYPNIDEDRVRKELPSWREIRKARDLD